MDDRTAITTRFVHKFTTPQMKKAVLTAEVVGFPKALRHFDEIHDVVLHDGTVVPTGTVDGTVYVRAPWTFDLPSQGKYVDKDGYVRDWVEADPRWVDGSPPGARRNPTRAVRSLVQEPGHLARHFESRKDAVTAWLDECVVVGGTPYVPTSGLSVHYVATRYDEARPMVRFGWGRSFDADTLIPDWREGWEPAVPGRDFRPGAIDVPPAVLAPPGALAMAQATVDAYGVLPSERVGEETWRVSKDWLTVAKGDWVGAAAVFCRPDGPRPSSIRDLLAVTRAVEAMTSEQRARFDRLVDPPEPISEPADPALDALTPGV